MASAEVVPLPRPVIFWLFIARAAVGAVMLLSGVLLGYLSVEAYPSVVTSVDTVGVARLLICWLFMLTEAVGLAILFRVVVFA